MPKSPGCAGSMSSVSSKSCVESSSLVLDCAHLGLAISSQSFSCAGFAALVSDLLHLESLPPLQLLGHFDSSVFALNFSHSEVPTSPHSVAWFGFFLSLCASCRLGPSSLVLDPLHLGSSSLLQALSHSGSFAFCLDMVLLGAALPPHSPAHLGAAILAASCSHSDAPPPLQSFVWSGSALFVLDCAHSELSSLSHSFG